MVETTSNIELITDLEVDECKWRLCFSQKACSWGSLRPSTHALSLVYLLLLWENPMTNCAEPIFLQICCIIFTWQSVEILNWRSCFTGLSSSLSKSFILCINNSRFNPLSKISTTEPLVTMGMSDSVPLAIDLFSCPVVGSMEKFARSLGDWSVHLDLHKYYYRCHSSMVNVLKLGKTDGDFKWFRFD